MKEIKPVETEYNGYRFRSRLEARWAVFFDAAGIKYEYEPEGFETEDGTRYLPDFYLPELHTYVEVKGNREGAWEEIRRAQEMIVWGSSIRRILVLSDIPTDFDGGMWHFPCFYWDGTSDIVWVGWWFFHDDYDDEEILKCRGHISSADYYPPWSILDDGTYRSYARNPISFQAVSDTVLRREKKIRMFMASYDVFGRETDVEALKQQNYEFNRTTYEAFRAARQARFEHGEKPRVKG